MGRIKGTLVKRSTKDLLAGDRTAFTGDFEHNKKAVSSAVPGISKKIRNSIAGYISRLLSKAEQK